MRSNFKNCVLAAMLAGSSGLTLAAPLKHLNANQSKISFSFKQMGVPVEGTFRKLSAEIQLDTQHPENTTGKFEIDLNSVDIPSPEANGEVRNKTWFNAAVFPKATLSIQKLQPLGGEQFKVQAQLNIKGKTQNLSFPLTIKKTGDGASVDGQTTIKRLDFAIGEGEWADIDTIANEVLVRFSIRLQP